MKLVAVGLTQVFFFFFTVDKFKLPVDCMLLKNGGYSLPLFQHPVLYLNNFVCISNWHYIEDDFDPKQGTTYMTYFGNFTDTVIGGTAPNQVIARSELEVDRQIYKE